MATRITISRIGQRNRNIVVDALNIESVSTDTITASGSSQTSTAAPGGATAQYGCYIQSDEAIWVIGGLAPVASVGEGYYIAAGDRQTFCIDPGHSIAVIAG